MNTIGPRIIGAEGDRDRHAVVLMEFEVYELMELKVEAKEALERGMSPHNARIMIERYDALDKAIKAASVAMKEA